MDVVTGATSTLLPKLTALLQDEYNLQKKVKKGIESTQKELIFMRAALSRVAEVPPERLDQQVKAWASNVKELSYDMEDAVDTYDVRVLVGGGHLDFDNTFVKGVVEMLDIKKGIARHQLGSVIEELMDLTRQLAELRDRYKLDDLGSTKPVPVPTALTQAMPVSRKYPIWTWWRRWADMTYSQIADYMGWVQQSHFKIFDTIGSQQEANLRLSSMEQTKHQLKTWLMTTNNSGADVCFIVGTKGVGKTTFVTELCRKQCGHFDRFCTVTLPDNLNNLNSTAATGQVITQRSSNNFPADGAATKKTLVLNLFRKSRGTGEKQTPESSNTDDDDDEAIIKIKNLKLERHSCLLLIDDLRSEETWNKVSDVLPINIDKKRCKIIVTTRFQAVATACAKGGAQIYYMNVLRGRSKDIFKSALSESELIKSGCKDGDKTPMMSDIIPPRLWEMCGEHLPLAVVMLAGYVSCNRDMSADGWELVCTKLVPDRRKILTFDGVPTILSHCYNDMPAEIKTCCLYLSMYPKGHKISRKHLTRKWVAEGFVTKKQGQSEEDVAEEYLDNLIKRKFIQPVEQSINLKVKNCQVYDLVHEFVVSKAGEENFVTVVGRSWTMPPPSGRIRRLSLTPFFREDGQKAIKGMDLSHVRSLTVHRSTERWPLKESLLSPIVQVLDLDGCKKLDKDKTAMKSICGMLLLRYLSLRRTDIKELHKDIGKLTNLEELDVRETQVTELPDGICQLQRLSKIFGGDKRERKALKLAKKMTFDKMKSLRILSGIEITIDSGPAKALEDLTYLRKLAIYRLIVPDESKMEPLQSSILSLCQANCLQTLVIEEDAHGKSSFLQSLSNSDLPFRNTTLTSLELSGRLANLPRWIESLSALSKLRLPVTVLCDNAHKVLKTLGGLSTLSSLTFFDHHTKGQAYEFTDHGENIPVQVKTKTEDDKPNVQIFVEAGGFENLKLLRFFSSLVLQLTFLDKAMPKLEKLELSFRNFDGIYGIENHGALKEVCLRVSEQADEFTTVLVDKIADAYTNRGIRIIRDDCHF